MNPSGLKAVPLPTEPVLPQDDRTLRADTPFRIEDIVAILRRRAWIVAVTTALAIAFAVFSLARITPQYVASAEMLLGGQGQIDRRSSDLFEERALSNTVIQGELAILESSALLIRVVRRLELDRDPEFNAQLRPPPAPVPFVDDAKALVKGVLKQILAPEGPAPAPAPPPSEAVAEASAARDAMLGGLDGPIGTLRRKMSVRQRGSSFVVAVTMSSDDPVKAAGIANTLVDEYIDFVVDKRFDAAQRFTTWLENRVAELARVVEESENAVLAYEAVVDSEVDSAARLDQQMQEMTSKLVNARAALAETEARVAKATALFDEEGLLAAASVLTSPALLDYNARLAELRQEERDATRRFGGGSAQVDSIRREASAIRVEFGIELRRALAELQNAAEILRINVSALEKTLVTLQGVILDRSKEQIKLNQLERVADANRRVYEDFLGRFKESSEIQNLRTADAEVISYASPPGSPATPRKKVTLVLAAVAGGFIGLGIVFLLELLPKRFSTSDEVTSRTGLRVFGHLPRLPRRNGARRLARLLGQDGQGGLALAARNMARNLELGLGRPLRSAIVVSNASGGDKTTLAMLVGWATVRAGRSCLLVDADVRGAALTGRFNLAPGPSLVDVLYDEAGIEDAVRTDPDLGLTILPTVPASADPATLFGTRRAGVLFRDLVERFDVVIIDAPPLESVSDMVSLPNPVDVGLYAIKSHRTAIKPVVERMPLFQALQMQVGGAVLTRLRSKGVRRLARSRHAAPRKQAG